VSYNTDLSVVVKQKYQLLTQREDTARSEPAARRRAWILGTALAVTALAVGSVFGDRGVLNLVEKRRQVEELRQQLNQLRTENARLSGEIAELRTSSRTIERLAREQLGYARPDETVFLIRDRDPDALP